MANANINADSCTVQTLERSLGMPGEGPKMIPLALDFTQNDSYTVDLSNLMQRGFIGMIQSVFADNSDSSVELVFTVNTSQQRLIVAAGDQAYLPILVPNPARLVISSPGGAATVTVQLLNFPIAPEAWNGAGGGAISSLPTQTVQFDQVSTDAELPIGSALDMSIQGTSRLNFHCKNTGAHAVNIFFYEYNRPDAADMEQTDNGAIPAGTFWSENLGTPFRFALVTIQSASAGQSGELIGAFYAFSD